MKRNLKLELLAAALAVAASVSSADETVTVSSYCGPWKWVDGGLNAAYRYGMVPYVDPAQPAVSFAADFADPTPVTFSLANGITFTPGDILSFDYVGGTWSYSASNLTQYPLTGPNGNLSMPAGFALTTYNGQPFVENPLYYVPTSEGSQYAQVLVGTFADSMGAIVGTPHIIPCQYSTVSFVIPSGATQFQLGNADAYSLDNAGSVTVRVREVPEPGVLSLLGAGCAGIAVLRRRRS